jgi:hypothetical protein
LESAAFVDRACSNPPALWLLSNSPQLVRAGGRD